MAKLTNCGTCGHQVSVNAAQCPNCGQKFKKKTSIFTWAIAALLGLPFLFSVFKTTSSQNNTQPQLENTNNIVASSATAQIPEVVNNWVYDLNNDKMRGTKSHFARTASLNNANFQFPYNGESHLHIQLRNKNNINEVMLVIDKGQFNCGIDDCLVAVKFDNQAIKTYSFVGSDSGSTDVIFLDSNTKPFIDMLKKSNNVMVEAPFFHEGKKQFEFKTSGLEWKF